MVGDWTGVCQDLPSAEHHIPPPSSKAHNLSLNTTAEISGCANGAKKCVSNLQFLQSSEDHTSVCWVPSLGSKAPPRPPMIQTRPLNSAIPNDFLGVKGA